MIEFLLLASFARTAIHAHGTGALPHALISLHPKASSDLESLFVNTSNAVVLALMLPVSAEATEESGSEVGSLYTCSTLKSKW